MNILGTKNLFSIFLLLFGLSFLFWPQGSNAESQDLRRSAVVKAVDKVSKSVVNIQATKVVERESSPFSQFFGNSNFFQPFFQDMFPTHKRRLVRNSLGSGVIINGSKGLVLTNAHVITGASDISVRLLDGREFEADLIGSDPDFDLSVLKLKGLGKNDQSLPEVTLGKSEDILIGEKVIAIGNPYGFSHTVTTGVISALNRTIETEQGTFMGFIQTDAAINPGNSGGPLLNILGEVIGINTAIFAKAQGIGFAIPVDKAQRVVQELVNYGYVHPVWIGLSGQDVDQRTAQYLNLDAPQGMLVTEVYKNAPADKAGIKTGDVIISLAGNDLKDKDQYLRRLMNVTRKERIELTVWRESKKFNFQLQPELFSQKKALALAENRWGFRLKESEQTRSLEVVQVKDNSPAQDLGLRSGDKIYKIAGKTMNNMESFVQVFMRYRMQNSLILLVARQGQGYYVRLRL